MNLEKAGVKRSFGTVAVHTSAFPIWVKLGKAGVDR